MLLPLIDGSRKDTGNISYDCNPVEGKPGTYIFRERWENQTVLDAHMQQKHFTDFAEAATPLMAGDLSVFVLGNSVA
ncbi:MAG: antibiotic biosynthesis monooxygenase [Lentisphaeria bacterium]|nr:antibiotic biosynthesis monooxygenase [Lentisphaeria bacterium]